MKRIVRFAAATAMAAVLAAPALAQTDPEEAAVRAAVEHYLQGHATGDGAHHSMVFHPVSSLYWISADTLATRTSEEYIAGSPGQPAEDEAERERWIEMVDVSGTAAVAKVILDYPRARFTDYFTLLEIGGEWKIVNKIFHVERKDEPAPEGRVETPADSVGEALMGLSRAWSEAAAAGDVEALLSYWAEDAVMMPPGQPRIRGKSAIRDYVAAASEIPGFRIRWEPLEAHVADSGDMAYLIERNWITVPDSAGAPVTERNKVVTVWRRQPDGAWKNVVDMWNADPTSGEEAADR